MTPASWVTRTRAIDIGRGGRAATPSIGVHPVIVRDQDIESAAAPRAADSFVPGGVSSHCEPRSDPGVRIGGRSALRFAGQRGVHAEVGRIPAVNPLEVGDDEELLGDAQAVPIRRQHHGGYAFGCASVVNGLEDVGRAALVCRPHRPRQRRGDARIGAGVTSRRARALTGRENRWVRHDVRRRIRRPRHRSALGGPDGPDQDEERTDGERDTDRADAAREKVHWPHGTEAMSDEAPRAINERQICRNVVLLVVGDPPSYDTSCGRFNSRSPVASRQILREG